MIFRELGVKIRLDRGRSRRWRPCHRAVTMAQSRAREKLSWLGTLGRKALKNRVKKTAPARVTTMGRACSSTSDSGGVRSGALAGPSGQEPPGWELSDWELPAAGQPAERPSSKAGVRSRMRKNQPTKNARGTRGKVN